jgi:hypothetical protein
LLAVCAGITGGSEDLAAVEAFMTHGLGCDCNECA